MAHQRLLKDEEVMFRLFVDRRKSKLKIEITGVTVLQPRHGPDQVWFKVASTEAVAAEYPWMFGEGEPVSLSLRAPHAQGRTLAKQLGWTGEIEFIKVETEYIT